MRRSLIFIILVSLTITSVFVQNGSALPTMDEADPLDPDIQTNSIVDTAEDEAADLWGKIKDTLYTIFDSVVSAFLAPFRAFETLTENWAESLSSWYAPILMGIVLIILLVMWRAFSFLDTVLDKTV